jgi:ammonia channel protein AmtB
MRRSELLAGLWRFALLSGVVVLITTGLSLVYGVLGHESSRRAVAVGLYLVGSICVIMGFAFGSRPPVRGEGQEGHVGLFGPLASRARWATREEQDDSWRSSALFVTLGFTVIAAGLVVDARDRLL